jgi:hypothetical protein
MVNIMLREKFRPPNSSLIVVMAYRTHGATSSNIRSVTAEKEAETEKTY